MARWRAINNRWDCRCLALLSKAYWGTLNVKLCKGCYWQQRAQGGQKDTKATAQLGLGSCQWQWPWDEVNRLSPFRGRSLRFVMRTSTHLRKYSHGGGTERRHSLRAAPEYGLDRKLWAGSTRGCVAIEFYKSIVWRDLPRRWGGKITESRNRQQIGHMAEPRAGCIFDFGRIVIEALLPRGSKRLRRVSSTAR